MPEQPQWQIQTSNPPQWLVQAIRQVMPELKGTVLAQLLWQRGFCKPEQIAGFLSAKYYKPANPFEFGGEMKLAVARLQQARNNQEIVGIWGDFDADGVTATAVLWDGLGQFFQPQKTLFYYIPNRLIESHGLSRQGLDVLKAKGCQLSVTCDTGSTNLEEIEYARSLGMDVIVTDHHTLPEMRPPVTAIINPRYLPEGHPLATLSGVAVAYKLVEALYEVMPDVPQQPLEHLLDLVAIGLIADLVELKGDCRYLAQRGIEQLQKQSDPTRATRPGVAKLLEFCKRTGDRPTDISFGLGPRINAVSRIQGDAHFCVELLTSQDRHLCTHLAEATELANARRKGLQKDVLQQVSDRLTQLDLSTTRVIVLADDQWQPGVLGLVAGQIAQEYGRPTILLSTEGWRQEEEARGERGKEEGGEIQNSKFGSADSPEAKIQNSSTPQSPIHSPTYSPTHPVTHPPQPLSPIPHPLAKGSARSVNAIDLYQLVKGQEHLLYRFGGHPFAAGLSLPVQNLPLFTEAINQQLRQQMGEQAIPAIYADLVVTVSDLGKDLFQELKLLEPCGIGNPAPRLLIQNCWFTNLWNKKIKDRRGQKIEYIKTEFELWDESSQQGFPGTWWGHYRDDFPPERCDAIVELDFNAYDRRYEVRIIALRPHAELTLLQQVEFNHEWILDWREPEEGIQESGGRRREAALSTQHSALTPAPSSLSPSTSPTSPSPLILSTPPASWTELQLWIRRAWQEQRPLAIAFSLPSTTPPMELWQQLVGIAKYLSRTGKLVTRQQLLDKLGIGDRALQAGCKSLVHLGFALKSLEHGIQIQVVEGKPLQPSHPVLMEAVRQFLIAVREERFHRQYFAQLPLASIQAIAAQVAATLNNSSNDGSNSAN
ncbi:MAG: DHH family phosphoesterase [Oscillatoriales cyanobacterium C42_A2020_001]|nr:DHH family phosphoesterase [Leptolyngbyaceae cyanobacterium C42_A2020_001]